MIILFQNLIKLFFSELCSTKKNIYTQLQPAESYRVYQTGKLKIIIPV